MSIDVKPVRTRVQCSLICEKQMAITSPVQIKRWAAEGQR